MGADVFEELRESLAASKRKGRRWEDAWCDGLSWAHAGRGEIRLILDETKDAWRRAYLDLEPTPAERALAGVIPDGLTEPAGDDDGGRRCIECGGLMVGRHVSAVTCGDGCALERHRRQQRERKRSMVQPRLAELETGGLQAHVAGVAA